MDIDLERDFKFDFINKYSKIEYVFICKLIDKMWEEDSDNFDQKNKLWILSLQKEKEGPLQYTYYINLSKETIGDDEEVNLEYESGINNGTQLRNYCLDGGGGPPRPIESIE